MSAAETSLDALTAAAEQIAAWRAEAQQQRRQEYAASKRGSIKVLGHAYTADTLERVADQLEQALGLTRPAPTPVRAGAAAAGVRR